jgi:dephospho-CoA kinase
MDSVEKNGGWSMKRHNVIAIVGMPGAGKSIVSNVASERGIPVLVCGDVVREETEKRGLPPTPENMGSVMLDVRREHGPAIVTERLIPKIQESTSPVVIVEGVRSMPEVNALKKDHSVTIVAVHASPRTRYERLNARARSDDPKSWTEFEERDSRELSVGIGNVIAMAQEMLINEASVEDLAAASELLLAKVTQNE